MRVKLHKITKLPKLDANIENQPSPSLSEKHNQNIKKTELQNTRYGSLVEVLDGLVKKSIRQARDFQLEARDRSVVLDLPEVQQNQLDDDTLQYWITDVCSSVFSSAFHFLSQDKMSYEHAKIFCSEGILRNIVLLTNKFKLTQRQIRLIDDHIEQKIVPYMKKKYPMTESTDVNKTIDESVKPIDNREALENDLLQKCDVVFTYRQNGNYNDLIMRFLNWMMNSLDSKESGSKMTVYEEYYNFVSRLFENVYDQGWMNYHPFDSSANLAETQKRNEILRAELDSLAGNKQKYKEQVKEYTHYAIGRKISKNIQTYSEQEITSGHLTIKSPSILRILTKWCEQLWQKFATKNYFLDRQQNVRVQEKDGNINTMFMWMKLPLNDMIEEEKQRIERFMEELQDNNYDQQSRLLLKELQKDGFTHVERIEKACGKFAFKAVNNLLCYITLYLNRIIHGLLSVSKQLFQTKLSSKARWTSPPDFITFKVGDLMRCKCSSKEREVLKIFQEMENLSDRQPKLCKIIRVKNRLKLGTNDILINVLFKDKYLCEFQLAVNSVRSKFIECSNMFSHYIYQLGRTMFGPLTQLSSVWMSLDPRSDEYLSIIKNQKREHNHQPLGCKKLNKSHSYQQIDRPFVCNSCNIAYSHTNYIWIHQKCINQGCNYNICARCRIESEDEQVLKHKLLEEESDKLREACRGIVNRKAEGQRVIPTFGVCIQIESKKIKIQRFKKLEIKKIKTIFGIKTNKNGEEQATLIDELVRKDAQKKFLRKYLVFEIPDNLGRELIELSIDKAKKDYIIPQKVKDIYKKQKQILSLIQENLDDESCKIMKGSRDGMDHIKNMELADNKLTNIRIITDNFPNLERLQLSRNRICSIDSISKLAFLTKLNLRDNRLEKLPDQITKLRLLEGLNIRNNFIKELPRQFGDLRELNKLESDNNQFTELPQSFKELVKLKFVDLSKNRLASFPEALRGFKALKDLALAQNSLGEIPEWIEGFKDLLTLDLAKAKCKNFPKAIYALKNLTVLKIESDQSQLLPDIGKLTNLHELALQMPNLQQIPNQIINLVSLQALQLQDCKMAELPDCLSQMKKLTSFSLINNRLERLSNELCEMVKLKYLRIQGQDISELSERMRDLTDLRTLSLDNNKFKQLPDAVLCYSKLYSLSIRKNLLQGLPDDMFLKLPEIEKLQVDNNNLNALPSSLRTLKKLKKVTYTWNPLDHPQWLDSCIKVDESYLK